MRPSMHFAAKTLGFKREIIGAEIGVEWGYNALSMLTTFYQLGLPLKKLYLVEINPECKVVINLTLKDMDGWELIIEDSFDAAKRFEDNSLDFVYIDDDHSALGVKRSLTAWYPKVKQHGIFAGHDYDKNDDDLSREVRNFFDEHDMNLLLDELDWWGIKIG